MTGNKNDIYHHKTVKEKYVVPLFLFAHCHRGINLLRDFSSHRTEEKNKTRQDKENIFLWTGTISCIRYWASNHLYIKEKDD